MDKRMIAALLQYDTSLFDAALRMSAEVKKKADAEREKAFEKYGCTSSYFSAKTLIETKEYNAQSRIKRDYDEAMMLLYCKAQKPDSFAYKLAQARLDDLKKEYFKK